MPFTKIKTIGKITIANKIMFLIIFESFIIEGFLKLNICEYI